VDFAKLICIVYLLLEEQVAGKQVQYLARFVMMEETIDVLDHQCQFEKLMDEKMFLMEQELLDAQMMQMDAVDPVVTYILDQEEKRE
jgi:hypothetical protein